MQTPLPLDIWLRSYEGFDNAKNSTKQMNLNTVFANISKTTSQHPTYSSSIDYCHCYIIPQFGNHQILCPKLINEI